MTNKFIAMQEAALLRAVNSRAFIHQLVLESILNEKSESKAISLADAIQNLFNTLSSYDKEQAVDSFLDEINDSYHTTSRSRKETNPYCKVKQEYLEQLTKDKKDIDEKFQAMLDCLTQTGLAAFIDHIADITTGSKETTKKDDTEHNEEDDASKLHSIVKFALKNVCEKCNQLKDDQKDELIASLMNAVNADDDEKNNVNALPTIDDKIIHISMQHSDRLNDITHIIDSFMNAHAEADEEEPDGSEDINTKIDDALAKFIRNPDEEKNELIDILTKLIEKCDGNSSIPDDVTDNSEKVKKLLANNAKNDDIEYIVKMFNSAIDIALAQKVEDSIPILKSFASSIKNITPNKKEHHSEEASSESSYEFKNDDVKNLADKIDSLSNEQFDNMFKQIIKMVKNYKRDIKDEFEGNTNSQKLDDLMYTVNSDKILNKASNIIIKHIANAVDSLIKTNEKNNEFNKAKNNYNSAVSIFSTDEMTKLADSLNHESFKIVKDELKNSFPEIDDDDFYGNRNSEQIENMLTTCSKNEQLSGKCDEIANRARDLVQSQKTAEEQAHEERRNNNNDDLSSVQDEILKYLENSSIEKKQKQKLASILLTTAKKTKKDKIPDFKHEYADILKGDETSAESLKKILSWFSDDELKAIANKAFSSKFGENSIKAGSMTSYASNCFKMLFQELKLARDKYDDDKLLNMKLGAALSKKFLPCVELKYHKNQKCIELVVKAGGEPDDKETKTIADLQNVFYDDDQNAGKKFSQLCNKAIITYKDAPTKDDSLKQLRDNYGLTFHGSDRANAYITNKIDDLLPCKVNGILTLCFILQPVNTASQRKSRLFAESSR